MARYYRCFYCSKPYKTEEEAEECKESHDLVYIPATVEDLQKLAKFLMHPDPEILREVPLVDVIFRKFRKHR